MAKHMFMVLVGWTLASCASSGGPGNSGTGKDRLEMTGLEEMSLEYIKGKWGDPDSNIPKGEGRVVVYKNVRSEDENPVSGKVTVKLCEVKLEFTKELLVKSWDYENCRVQAPVK